MFTSSDAVRQCNGATPTLFSSEAFTRAWAEGISGDVSLIEIPVGSGARAGTMFGVARPCGRSFATAEFGPDGLYACPAPWDDEQHNAAGEALDKFRQQRLLGVEWNVRFDHAPLARQLQRADIPCRVSTTHVLALDRPHAELFAAYRPTRRNEIRRCAKQGVLIRRVESDAEVSAYCGLHQKLATQKDGFRVKYPLKLIRELVSLRDYVHLLIAEFDSKMVAGALFFVDGNSILYWHAAADREWARLFAGGALVDKGIQLGCEMGLSTFNFGASDRDSVGDFKRSFGANPRESWNFRVNWKKPWFFRVRDRLLTSVSSS